MGRKNGKSAMTTFPLRGRIWWRCSTSLDPHVISHPFPCVEWTISNRFVVIVYRTINLYILSISDRLSSQELSQNLKYKLPRRRNSLPYFFPRKVYPNFNKTAGKRTRNVHYYCRCVFSSFTTHKEIYRAMHVEIHESSRNLNIPIHSCLMSRQMRVK